MWLSYFFGFISYNITALVSFIAVNYGIKIKNNQHRIFAMICCLIYFVIATIGNVMTNDYFPYKEIISVIHSTRNPFLHIEPFWISVIKYFDLSHCQYVFFLESISFALFYIMLRQLKPKNIILFVSLWTFFLFVHVIGGRAILFYMTFLLGLTLFVNKKYVIGLILLVLSFFFHKTAYIGIPLFILSLFSLSKNGLRLIFLSSLTISLVLRATVMNNVGLIYEFISGAGIQGSIYITYEENINATGMAIWSILPLMLYMIWIGFSIYTLYRLLPYLNVMTSLQVKFYYLAFWGMTVSIAVRLLNLPDPTISVRVLTIIMTPIIYLYTILREYMPPLKYEHKLLLLMLLILLLISDVCTLRVMFINNIFS